MASIAATNPQQEHKPGLKLAFCLFKYFPFGGMQRDFLRIAQEVQARGHSIRVYTLAWQGEIPAGFEVVIVSVNAITNHARYRKYHRWVAKHLERWPVDRLIGFNKMPGLDVYYAADSCYEDKVLNQRNPLYRLLPRYKLFSAFEEAVFGKASVTRVLMISPLLTPVFQKHYGTQEERFHLLAPGIDRSRIAPPDREEIRQACRSEMGIESDELLLLMVGSGFITKGLDRVLIALSALPPNLLQRTRLFVIGQDLSRSFERMAKRLGVAERVTIFKGRDDIPNFLFAADLLTHPAYTETTGTVLLEAIVAGLPVIATDVCGYAHYIEEAEAGLVTPSPFRQETFNTMLQQMMASDERAVWSANGIRFAQTADIYDLPMRAAELICAAEST